MSAAAVAPTPELLWSQGEFVQAEQPRALFTGGLGAGKTHALAFSALEWSSRFPRAQWLLAGPSFKALRNDVIPKLKELLGAMGWGYTHHRTDWHIRPDWCVGDDAGMWLQGCEDPDSIKGPNRSGLFMNEPGIISRESYQMCLGRVRVPLVRCGNCNTQRAETVDALGIVSPEVGETYVVTPCESCDSPAAVIVANPVRLAGTPEGFNWLYDEYIDQSQHPGRDWGEVLVVTADTRENVHLPTAYAGLLLDSFDDKLAEEKVAGKFVNVSTGRIYYRFDRETHVAPVEYDPTRELLWSLDFNVHPFCTIVAHAVRGPHGEELHVLDEVTLADEGYTTEAVGVFARRYAGHVGGVRVFGDASGRQRRTVASGQRSDWAIVRSELARHGVKRWRIDVAPSNPSRRDRYASVNALCRSASGHVRLVVDPKAKRLIKDLEQQAFKVGTDIANEGEGKQMGHAADALGYVAIKVNPIGTGTCRAVAV